MANTTSRPPTAPISVAPRAVGASGSAVIATRPARAPLMGHGQVGLAEPQFGQDDRGDHATGSGGLVLTNT